MVVASVSDCVPYCCCAVSCTASVCCCASVLGCAPSFLSPPPEPPQLIRSDAVRQIIIMIATHFLIANTLLRYVCLIVQVSVIFIISYFIISYFIISENLFNCKSLNKSRGLSSCASVAGHTVTRSVTGRFPFQIGLQPMENALEPSQGCGPRAKQQSVWRGCDL